MARAKKIEEVHPEEGRTKLDVYPTPEKVVRAIVKRVAELYPQPPFIIEPSAGSGVFVKVLREHYPNTPIIANELRVEEGHALAASGANNVYHEDWESLVRRWGPSMGAAPLILGNPPFSLATRHVAATMESCPVGTTLGFLLKQNILGGVDRAAKFWPHHPYKFKIPLVPRPSFKKTAKASNDTNEYAVFFWEVGYVGPSITLFPHIIWR